MSSILNGMIGDMIYFAFFPERKSKFQNEEVRIRQSWDWNSLLYSTRLCHQASHLGFHGPMIFTFWTVALCPSAFTLRSALNGHYSAPCWWGELYPSSVSSHSLHHLTRKRQAGHTRPAAHWVRCRVRYQRRGEREFSKVDAWPYRLFGPSQVLGFRHPIAEEPS